MKTLICVDSSAQCEKIFLASKNILAARVPAAEITILHVVADQHDNTNVKDINELAKQYFNTDFYYMEVKGIILDEIYQALNNAQYDLIIFGTKGHSAFTNIILGSTAEYLLHHVKIPMLLVP
ncbi:MAG: universal stress protein [Bacteroidetes bacterium]|nr:universal stress protein [Bacteroidota bacterium]